MTLVCSVAIDSDRQSIDDKYMGKVVHLKAVCPRRRVQIEAVRVERDIPTTTNPLNFCLLLTKDAVIQELQVCENVSPTTF
jgi:hypothetical protein